VNYLRTWPCDCTEFFFVEVVEKSAYDSLVAENAQLKAALEEGANNMGQGFATEIAASKAENARLRSALQFYADKAVYVISIKFPGDNHLIDVSHVAREALGPGDAKALDGTKVLEAFERLESSGAPSPALHMLDIRAKKGDVK
jgi:hypothetical protein